MKKLIRVECYLRGFTFRSLFVADEVDWAKIGKWCREERKVRFGEIGGKHSDVVITFSLPDFEVISEDQNFITQFRYVVGDQFGHFVPGYMFGRCTECGDDLETDDDGLCLSCGEELNG